MLKKRINFNKVKRIVINGRVDKLRKERLNIETGIVKRTLKGKDVKLKRFGTYAPYSKNYENYRKRHGRSSKVNLTYTGAMLGAIIGKNIKDGLRFKFSSSAETKKATWNQKTRRFFGVDKTQIRYLKKVMGKL